MGPLRQRPHLGMVVRPHRSRPLLVAGVLAAVPVDARRFAKQAMAEVIETSAREYRDRVLRVDLPARSRRQTSFALPFIVFVPLVSGFVFWHLEALSDERGWTKAQARVVAYPTPVLALGFFLVQQWSSSWHEVVSRAIPASEGAGQGRPERRRPGRVGAALLVAAMILLLAVRGRLARSIRTAPPSQRARRLRGSAISAAVFIAATAGYFVVIWDEEASTLGLLGTSLTALAALVAAIVLLGAGLLTSRTTDLSA